MKIGQKTTNQRSTEDADDGRNNTGMMNYSQSQSFIR